MPGATKQRGQPIHIAHVGWSGSCGHLRDIQRVYPKRRQTEEGQVERPGQLGAMHPLTKCI